MIRQNISGYALRLKMFSFFGVKVPVEMKVFVVNKSGFFSDLRFLWNTSV